MSLVRCGGVTYSDNISQARMWCQQTARAALLAGRWGSVG